MRRGVRRAMITITAATALCAAAGLAFLRTGRPVTYTDGSRVVFAHALADASMLAWSRPVPEVELPGPVEGRVQPLADGRLVYGRVVDVGATDLVVFDPAHPDVGAVSWAGLNSPGHDLAPALDVDGSLLFASDRAGGAGGFDLWRARLDGGVVRDVVRLADGVNSAADETDPAPDPQGGLVFVRRDPTRADGRNGTLHRADAAGVVGPLWDAEAAPTAGTVDRDPCFAPDGVGLWFVRRRLGFPATLEHAWRRDGRFGASVAVHAASDGGTIRGPVVVERGFGLLLLKPEPTPLLCRARAHELYPYPEGVRELERLLLAALIASLVLLALLLLGKRFRQLDVITWCLLISLLLHILVLLLFGDLLIERKIAPVEGDGRFVVELVSGGEAGGASSVAEASALAEDASAGDVAAAIRFRGHDVEVAAAAPTSADDAAVAGAGRSTEPEPTPDVAPAPRADATAAAAGAALADAAPAIEPTFTGVDGTSAAPAAQNVSPNAAATTAVRGERAPAADDGGVAVYVPAAATARGGRSSAPATPDAAAASTPTPRAHGVEAPSANLSDAPRSDLASAARNGSDAAPGRPTPSGVADPAVSTETPGSVRRADATARSGGGEKVTVEVPGGALERAARSARSAAALGDAVPVAARGGAAVVGPATVRDDARATTGEAVAAQSGGRKGGEDAAPSAPRPKQDFALGGPSAGPTDRPRRASSASDDEAAPQDGGGADLAGGVLPPPSDLARGGRSGGASEPTAGAPSLFENRRGPGKVAALASFGGGVETERAVALGLRYLASIQARDGSWGDHAIRPAKYGETFVGKSALCLLAFLGAGHTPSSNTEHSDVAARSVAHLLAEQDARTGHFGVSCAYSHGIATYALTECYALTKDPALAAPLEAALRWIEKNQDRGRDKRSRGGWGYYSATIRPEDRFARTSVSSWQVMALESAKLAGLQVREDALPLAREFLLNNFDAEEGVFLYNREPGRLASGWRTLPASTPAAAFVLRLLGVAADDTRLNTALAYTLERAPSAYRRASTDEFVRNAAGNVYFWYYGTLACFLAGGDVWTAWNESLKAVLLPAQAADGSFAPIDSYAEYAGDTKKNRAYTTALCVLSLEVYYRYVTPLLVGR